VNISYLSKLFELFFDFSSKKASCESPTLRSLSEVGKRHNKNNKEIPAFAGIYLGSTGFDSETRWIVSTSCNDFETRKRLGQISNGENNYALAA